MRDLKARYYIKFSPWIELTWDSILQEIVLCEGARQQLVINQETKLVQTLHTPHSHHYEQRTLISVFKIWKLALTQHSTQNSVPIVLLKLFVYDGSQENLQLEQAIIHPNVCYYNDYW